LPPNLIEEVFFAVRDGSHGDHFRRGHAHVRRAIFVSMNGRRRMHHDVEVDIQKIN
jgi:hypothetical protein